jgi:Tol biopolymer transport system component
MLVSIRTRNQTEQLGWISLAEGSLRVIKTFTWNTLGTVALSRDGRYIAYDLLNSDNPANRTIFCLAPDGSRELALTDGAARDELFGWMPDGEAILFATNRTGQRELWALPVEQGKAGGAPKAVKPDIGPIYPLGITKNGSLFLRPGHHERSDLHGNHRLGIQPHLDAEGGCAEMGGRLWA